MNLIKTTVPLIPFYFIRHGQTDWNLENRAQGWTDIPLNETGHTQAGAAIPFLSDRGITRIISSPLIRAHKTAQIINDRLKVPLHVSDGLKERSVGILEGKIKDTSIDPVAYYTVSIENGEHADDFKARIASALHDVLDPEHTTLIVAHGGVYWAIMEMMGFQEQRSHNCVPYLFVPPANGHTAWTVHKLDIKAPADVA